MYIFMVIYQHHRKGVRGKERASERMSESERESKREIAPLEAKYLV